MVQIEVKGFVIDAPTQAEGFAAIARHMGCIADGEVPDAGLPIAHVVTDLGEES